MPFKIIRNDITKVAADVIVNTANTEPLVGSGTDAGIYRAAGKEQLLEARRAIGRIKPGDIAVTEAFDLPAKYIIHAVSRQWEGGSRDEEDILRSCYRKSLAKAEELGAKSIAFPIMGSGAHRFQKGMALDIALSEIREFLNHSEMEVILVVFSTEAFVLSEHLLGDIESFIDANYVEETHMMEYPSREWMEKEKRRYQILFGEDLAYDGADDDQGEELFVETAPFTEKLWEYIIRSGEQPSDIYKRANMDRRTFSRIINGKTARVSKNDCMALAVALKLSLAESEDFLARADWAFNPSSVFDSIVKKSIADGRYDIYELDAVLFRYTERTLSKAES
ncbi:MAG: macro domain-containing protein [Anaerovoracaceae bacterium]|jgi:O-acetyl-ADP-ribose deacetylase (regulator of RNase III)